MDIFRSAALFALASIVGSTAAPVTAVAQSDRDAGPTIDEITVTARKREESLQEAPLAVAAFDSNTIEERGLQSIDDIARFAPGLSFSRAFGRSTERPVIRGLSNVLANVQFGVESGAAYFVDGIYYPGPIQTLDLEDLERVEVIRGPQSALYGRNTYSGAVNFISRGPSDELRIKAKALGASDGEGDYRVSVSGPIIEGTLGASFSARTYEYDGEFTNTVTGETVGGESTDSFSGVIDWTPTDSLRIRVRGQYTEDDDGPLALYLQDATQNNCFPGLRSLSSWPLTGSTNNNQYFCGELRPGTVALNTAEALPGQPVPNPALPPGSTFFGTLYNTKDGTAFDGIEREVTLFSAIADYEFAGGYVLTIDGAMRDEDEKFGSDSDHSSVNFTFAPPPFNANEEGFFANTNRNEIEDFSAEIKLASPLDAPVRWMFGAFHYEGEDRGRDITFTELDGGPVQDVSDIINTAFFGYVEVDFNDQLTASVEARSAEETKDLWEDGGFVGSAKFENFTPRVTVDYKVNEDTLFYGIVAKGVKPGGLNGDIGLGVGKPTYAQEESWNYEFGIKSTSFDGRLQSNVAVYFIDAEDVQLTTAVADGVGALTSIATNQGKGQIFGVELDIKAAITENLDAGFTYALADSEFTEGCDEFQWTLTSGGGRFVGNESDSADFTGFGDCSINGNQFPLSSQHQASAYFNWYFPLSGESEFFLSGDASYESKKYIQVHNLAYAPAATIAGLRAGYARRNWRITAFARNLFDEDSITLATRWLTVPIVSPGFSLNTASFIPGTDTATPRAFFGSLRRGRQVGLEVTYSFGE